MIKAGFSLLILLTTLPAACPRQSHADLPTLTVLHTFGSLNFGGSKDTAGVNLDGGWAEAPLMQGRDGMLYGITQSGGEHGNGVIFKINTDGTGFTVLHSFDAAMSSPEGPLVQDNNQTLYGAVGKGGKGGGAVFKMNADGGGFTTLHAFDVFGDLGRNDGGSVPLGVVLASDGLLYGTTALGSPSGEGIVFSVETSSGKFRILHTFSEAIYGNHDNTDGAHPNTALVSGNGTAFYGTTMRGGKPGRGILYKIMMGGKGFAVLHEFQKNARLHKNSAADPISTLTVGPDGFLYGNTQQEGDTDGGAIFRMGADGSDYMILHNFSSTDINNVDGSLPAGPLVLGPDGRLYGITGEGGEGGSGTLFWVSTDGAKFAVQHDFGSPDSKTHNTDGGFTLTGLTLGHDGSLYGISSFGGANGTGTIFRITFAAAK